ncbi:MAG: ComEC/Rec2 family competence protein [Clostridia bacterium]|nr:ComEC/Rec2 family competence protein [Clostridia bacterium]
MKRPLWTIGLCFSLGLLTAATVELRLCMVLGAICGVLAIFAVCLPDWRHTAAPAALFSAAAAFCIFTAQYLRLVLPAENYIDSEVTISATVTQADGTYLTAKITSGDLPEGTLLRVYAKEIDAEVGSRLSGHCYVQAHDSGFARLVTYDPLTVSPGEGLRYSLALWRRQLGQDYATLDETSSGILWAMCLGDARSLPTAVTTDFRMAGTAHLLVVSGLHVSIIAAAVLFLLKKLRRPHFLRPLLAMIAVLLYMGLTGFHYSVLRAGIMQLVFLSGTLLGRESDGRNSLGGALLLILLLDTSAVYDTGLWMSASSIAGLLILYPAWRRKLLVSKTLSSQKRAVRLARWTLDSLLISLSAVVAIAPVQLIVFRQFTWISPFSNLLAVPVATPLVITGGLAALTSLSPALTFLTTPLLFLADLLSRYLTGVSALFARIPYATLTVDSPYLITWILGSMVLILLGWYLFKGRGIRAALLCSAVTLTAGAGVFALAMQGVTTVQALPVGDGTALLATNPEYTILVLTGETKATARSAATQLSANGVWQIDWLLLPSTVQSGIVTEALTDHGIAIERIAVTTADESLSEGIPCTLWHTALSLGDDWCVERLSAGWLRLWLNDTCCLITPPDGDASQLNADWRSAHLLIYDRVPPLHNTALTARQGIVCCEPEALSGVTKALPHGLYPLWFTVDHTVTIYTRGRGDLYLPKEE